MKNILIIVFALQPFLAFGQPGSLDGSFGIDGKVTTSFGNTSDFGKSVILQPDGKILVAGSSYDGADTYFAIARYNSDGSLDNTFSFDGKVTTSVNGNNYGESLALQSDGKILVGGYSSQLNSVKRDFAIARYNSDGTLDNTFSQDGKLTIDIGTNQDDYGCCIVVQPDGRILMAGVSNDNSNFNISENFAVIRLNPDGSLDNSFDNDGKITTDILISDYPSSMVLQSDGKILVAGTSLDNQYDSYYAVTRYNYDGSLDSDFSADGIMIQDISGPIGNDFAKDIAIQPDGKILIVGNKQASFNEENDLLFMRYYPDGSLDNTFNTTGIVETDIGNNYNVGTSVVPQFDGKILVAGSFHDSNDAGFALLRYNLNGSLDNSFGLNGVVKTSFNGYGYANDCTVQSDGKILVVGGASGNFALARYNSGLNVGLMDFSLVENSLLIYPNPLQNLEILEYELKADETISIDLIDINGSIIKSFISSEKRNAGIHKEVMKMDKKLANGIFFFNLHNQFKSIFIKVIKI